MSKRNLFDELAEGLEEARRYERGETELVTHVYDPPNVKAIRERTGLSQARFAALIGVPKRTLQNWEQGHRHPSGTARALLKIVAKKPDAIEALHD